MPGYKITMLPDEVVQAYTLLAGRDCPAVSLYVEYDEASLAPKGTRTVLERVPITHNLRHDQLDAVITEDWLRGGDPGAADETHPVHGLRDELSFLFRLATHLKSLREIVRGKPEKFTRPDYNFRLVDHDGAEPTGQERVEITERRRGAPLDLIVSEAMIQANSSRG